MPKKFVKLQEIEKNILVYVLDENISGGIIITKDGSVYQFAGCNEAEEVFMKIEHNHIQRHWKDHSIEYPIFTRKELRPAQKRKVYNMLYES
ncbi:hypothetical protein [Caudoviricetes sp.]|nr:hypothetical protein [Caudoviricetes sp.]